MRASRPLIPAFICLLFLSLCPLLPAQGSAPPTPSEFLKFQVGADRQLADYAQISAYLRALDAASPRVEIETLGKTTLGKEMIMAVISSEENLRNKEKQKEIAAGLADPRGLTPQQIDALAQQGKSILLVTCNIHSTEIGSSQMAMEWAYKLATANDPETEKQLNDVILLLVPSLNPDGETMVTEWYRKYVGTPYEGGPMPYLYHHYVGHDDNRDWYMLTQAETQNVTRMAYHEWHPQFWLDEHQMGMYGPRIYIPPNADPVSKLVNPLIHRGNNLMGATMGWRLQEAGKKGVIYDYEFDAYWPGGTRSTPWWKNIYGVLTEVASARIATPVTIEPTELEGDAKGLLQYKQQINFPDPWPGGVWRLRDIMDYELIISDAALETASKFREALLRGVAQMAQQSIDSAPANTFWRIPLSGQRDPVVATQLAALMLQHGVEVRQPADKSSYLIPLAQPYGRFVEEMMGKQRYPEVQLAPNSGILEPYDVAAWSLPLMMGVDAEKVTLSPEQQTSAVAVKEVTWPEGGLSGSGDYFALADGQDNVSALINAMQKAGDQVFVAGTGTSAKVYFAANPKLSTEAARLHLMLTAAASLPQGARQIKAVRVGLYKPYIASMDEGWTRFILERYGYNLKNIENKEMMAGNLNASYDAIILPDTTKEIIEDGRYSREGYHEEFPPEYQGGIGKEGMHALIDFVHNGGTLITLARSSSIISDGFNLPVRNTLQEVKQSDFNIPGSLLHVNVDNSHPVTAGLPGDLNIFVDAPIAFQTSVPSPDVKRTVLAWYPPDEKDILVSGYAHGADKLTRKAAAVAFTQGKGKVVMLGFRVQHRAQTEGTFPLLFNAIRWAGMQ